MRIILLPTGMLELHALQLALARLFPSHDFESLPEVETIGTSEARPYNGFTSAPLPLVPGPVNANLDKIIGRAAAEAGKSDVDGVVVVDDLELSNAQQPAVVVSEVRAAVDRHLTSLQGKLRERTELRFREKVSVHFAAPMVESWLFADPGGLARLSQPPRPLPAVVGSAPDFESFRTADPAYAADNGSGCPYWMGLPPIKRTRKDQQPDWVRWGARRVEHPKAYVSWLLRSPGARRCTEYAETEHGVRALAGLDWPAVLASGQQLPFLRSLVADLADLLNVPSPAGSGVEPLTSRHHLPSDPRLRNL